MDRPEKTAAKPLAGSTGAARRAGCSPEHNRQVTAHFMASADLRSTCRTCGHHRRGTFAEVSGPCPVCRTGG